MLVPLFGQVAFMSTPNSDLEKGILPNGIANPSEDIRVSRSSSTMLNEEKVDAVKGRKSHKKHFILWYHKHSNILLILTFLLAPGLYVLFTGFNESNSTDGIDVITWTIAISISFGSYLIVFYLFRFFVRFARDNLIRSEDYNRVARIQNLMPYIKGVILSFCAFLVFTFYIQPKSINKDSIVQKILLGVFISVVIICAHKWSMIEFSASYKKILYGDRLKSVNANTTAITYLLEVQHDRIEATRKLEQNLNRQSRNRKGSGQGIVDTIKEVHMRTKTWKDSLSGSKSNTISFKDSPIHTPAFAISPTRQVYPVMKNKLKFKSAEEARKVALALFDYLKKPSRDYLIPEDLFLLIENKEKIDSIFKVFDVNGDGSITRRELRQRFVLIYEEFWRLNSSMSTADYALRQLDTITLIIVLVIICFSWLIVFNYNIQSLLIIMSSTVLGYVFVIGNSAKNLFECLVFVFITQYMFLM
eukprot:NODE_1_length_95616_cov_0.657642.p10 type:complete len:474 gc:universal NODE_1_length_95616_cov_0.657642:30845-32266(+)